MLIVIQCCHKRDVSDKLLKIFVTWFIIDITQFYKQTKEKRLIEHLNR